MSKKRGISLVIILLGILFILGGFFINFDKGLKEDEKPSIKEQEENDEEKKDDDIGEDVPPVTIDYDQAYNIAVSLYGGEGKEIEVVEESDRFVIYVFSSDGKQTFYMDKVSGDISSNDEGTIS